MDNVDNFVDKLGLDLYLGVFAGKKRVKIARYRGKIKKIMCGQNVHNVGIGCKMPKNVKENLWIMWITSLVCG